MINQEGECPTEEQLLKAMANGVLEWAEHIRSCSKCRSFVDTVEFIRRESHDARLKAQLPSAQWIMFHSETRRRREAAKDATQPLRWMSICGIATGLTIAIITLYTSLSTLFGASSSLSPGNSPLSSEFGTYIMAAALPIILLVTGVLQIIWAED